MLKVENFIEALKHLAIGRKTHYNNTFPFNCGYIDYEKAISFDCIGLVKSLINEPDIAYRSNPIGYYVRPGQIIPDLSEIQILYTCSNVGWGSGFHSAKPGSYLYMEGHAGVYIGDCGNVNVIECTLGWGCDGVVCSWVDDDGTRRDQKNGNISGSWEAHGELTQYIDYQAKPEPQPTGIKFKYRVFSDVVNQWLDEVTNTELDLNGDDYAGIYGDDIKCVLCRCNSGDVKYAVHLWKGDSSEWYGRSEWLPEVLNTEDYAGLYKQPADAFILFSDVPAMYRVRLRKTGEWLPWVYTKDADYGNSIKGYAGNIGDPFDALQIKPV